jgi:hypothetical protein
MAQTNFTPISLYYSTTAAAVPTAGNLVAGELAINTQDGKLFYKDAAGVVQTIATKGGVGSSSTTQVLYNNAGTIAGSANFVFDGTNVGIGTSSPTEKLDVLGTSDTTVRFRATSDTALILNETTPNKSWKIKSSDGTLAFQYSATAYNSGYASRMAITSAGDVGIGNTVASTIDSQNNAGNLVVGSGSGNEGITVYSATTGNGTLAFADGTSAGDTYRGYVQYEQNNNAFAFGTNAVERMRIASTGRIQIGSSATPSASSALVSLVGAPSGGASCTQQFTYNGGTFGGSLIGSSSQGGGMEFYTFTGNVGSETYSERMRINSSGQLIVGSSSTTNNARLEVYQASANWAFGIRNAANDSGMYITNGSGTAAYTAIGFYNNGTSFSFCGAITPSGTGTTYSTSSDYRLKENISPMIGALAKIALLKPVTYKWKTDGSNGQGFIAHELQEVVPECVIGEKDGLDKYGKPQYQGVDTSFLVATLTSAIQEQQALIENLTTRLNALEGK